LGENLVFGDGKSGCKLGIHFGLQGGGTTGLLEPLQQTVSLKVGVRRWIAATLALPDPKMRPLLDHAFANAFTTANGLNL
jgi:hypothetical protein